MKNFAIFLVTLVTLSIFTVNSVEASNTKSIFEKTEKEFCIDEFYNEMTGQPFVDDLSLICGEYWKEETTKLQKEFENFYKQVDKSFEDTYHTGWF